MLQRKVHRSPAPVLDRAAPLASPGREPDPVVAVSDFDAYHRRASTSRCEGPGDDITDCPVVAANRAPW